MPAAWPLFAADVGSLLRAAGKLRLRGGMGWGGPAGLLAVAAVAAGLVWLISLWLKAREERNRNSPLRLLKELFAAHHFSRRERELLTRLAEHHHLLQPATLFVEPRLWEPDSLPALKGSAKASELTALRDRLFARPMGSEGVREGSH